MIEEKSCGAVVFTKDTQGVKYVIIESKDGVFGLPKGHVENGEGELETARREVLEETGLHVEFLDGFREEESYVFYRNGEPRIKRVIYFLATFLNQIPVAQESELNSICLADYKAALSLFQFENP